MSFNRQPIGVRVSADPERVRLTAGGWLAVKRKLSRLALDRRLLLEKLRPPNQHKLLILQKDSPLSSITAKPTGSLSIRSSA